MQIMDCKLGGRKLFGRVHFQSEYGHRPRLPSISGAKKEKELRILVLCIVVPSISHITIIDESTVYLK